MSDLSARTAVIVDGHPLWLDALESLLKRLQVQVVGRATQAQDAGRLIAEHAPDVLVTDYSAVARTGDPSTNWSALAQARAANPDVKCIVLSEADDPRERELAFAAGATVFCVKRTEPDDLAAAIRQSFDNSIHFCRPELRLAEAPQPAPKLVGEDLPELTKREVEILRLVAEGHSNSQLARMLWVTEQTVKFHLSNIYRKLNVANRTEASRWAQRQGMLDILEPAPAVAISA
jgi:DNA-binding NarL/FixJ family response regulator